MPRSADHPPASRPMPPDEADRVAELMAAFGAASRVRLLYALVGIERSVEDLATATGLTPGVVSQQLRVLRLFRLVEGRRDGRHVRYRLQGEHVAELLTAVRAHTDHTTDAQPATDPDAAEGPPPTEAPIRHRRAGSGG